jgi:hypothetical protein
VGPRHGRPIRVPGITAQGGTSATRSEEVCGVPFNLPAKNVMLDGIDESIAAGIKYVGVGDVSDPGTGTNYAGTEATGGSPAYARQAVTFGAAASGQKSNSGALTIDVAAGNYGVLLFFNTLTGNSNSYLGYAPINGTVKGFGETDSTGVTNDTITSSGHGLSNTDRVQVFNVFAESLPAGLTEGTIYYVVSAATDTFKVSLTSGGAAVDITGQGECFFQKVIPETFGSQGQITVAVGALVLDGTGI